MASTTLSELVLTGGGGFTGDISGTNLSVTSVHNATPIFTGGTPGTIAGLDTVEFPTGSNIIFTGSGTMPTSISKNTQYVILNSSATAATIALPTTPTVPLAFTGSGSGTIAATKAICVGGAIAGTGVGGAPTIVSLPGGATHGCNFGVTGTYVLSGTPTGGASFHPVFTGGTPGTISGLTAANFPVNSYVAFYDGGSGVLPTGLSFNTLYIVSTSSSTVAQIAAASAPTTPLAFTGSGSGTILADEKMTSTGQNAVSVAACPSSALPTATPIDDTTSFPHTELGTQSSCTSSILTFQANSLVPGKSGDTIKWMQELSAGVIQGGPSPILTTGSCSGSAPTGGLLTGTFVAATCTTSNYKISGLPTATNGWNCYVSDRTTPADILTETASTTTSATISGSTVASDVIQFSCNMY